MFQRSADFVLYSSHQAQTPNFSSLLCSVTAFSGALGLHCMCAGIGCGGDDPAQIKDNLPCRLNVIIQNWSTGQRLLNMYMTSFTSWCTPTLCLKSYCCVGFFLVKCASLGSLFRIMNYSLNNSTLT